MVNTRATKEAIWNDKIDEGIRVHEREEGDGDLM
jgi:hypothetical protein